MVSNWINLDMEIVSRRCFGLGMAQIQRLVKFSHVGKVRDAVITTLFSQCIWGRGDSRKGGDKGGVKLGRIREGNDAF